MTPIEWLITELNHCKKESEFIKVTPDYLKNVLGQKALEMEAEQKAYTEEQVRQAIELAKESSICECAMGTHIEYEHSEDSIIEQLKKRK